VTDGALAARLGLSAETVRKYRSGQRRWSAKFEARLNAVVTAWGGPGAS
jgi:hypothetical protein